MRVRKGAVLTNLYTFALLIGLVSPVIPSHFYPRQYQQKYIKAKPGPPVFTLVYSQLSPMTSPALITTWGEPYGFAQPIGIAISTTGKIYVADTGNHRIQAFDATGKLLHSWGSQGNKEGEFEHPQGLVVAENGDVYVLDTGNNRVQKFAADGRFIKTWGSWGSDIGQFQLPFAMAIDLVGRLYIADTFNHRVQIFDQEGAFLSTWGTLGSEEGQFTFPQGIALDGEGNIYIADTGNHRIQIFDGNGQLIDIYEGQFQAPQGIAVDTQGTLYVADASAHCIQVVQAPEFVVACLAFEDSLFYPQGLTLSGDDLYIADTGNNRIHLLRLLVPHPLEEQSKHND